MMPMSITEMAEVRPNSTDRQNCKEVIMLDHSQTNNTGQSLPLGLWDGLKIKCQTKNKFPDFQYG